MFKNINKQIDVEYKDTRLRLKPTAPKGKRTAWNLSVDHGNLNIRKTEDENSNASDDNDSLWQTDTLIEELPSCRIDKFNSVASSINDHSHMFDTKRQESKSKIVNVSNYAK
jgi:hypothetical protein